MNNILCKTLRYDNDVSEDILCKTLRCDNDVSEDIAQTSRPKAEATA